MSWGADMFNPNWPEATAFVHLCAADIGPIQSADVYTNHGVVNDGAFAQCDPGYTGRGFSVSWSNAHGPILLEGSNSFWGNICDANGQCGGGSGELVYTPPKDSGVTILPQATLKATVDQWDTLRFTISDTDSRGPFVYDSVTLSCEMSSCQRIGSSVSVPLGGSNSVSVRFRATATGAHPFSLRYCRAVGFGPEIWSCTHYYTDNVVAVPASPVARKIQVSALNAPFYRQSGTGPTSVPFRVKNTGTDSTTIQFSAVCPTTVTAAGCTHPASAKLNADESITVNLAFTPTAPGTSVHGTLTLTGSALGEVVSAQAGVEVGPTDGVTPQVTLTLAGLNPEGSVSRDQCLSIAAGDAAGVECGALRLVHAIQGIQTMGRQRDLSFSYVSTHARATALVAANVSIVNAATDSVRATLQVSGLSALTRTYAWPSACRGVACRLVFPIPADSLGIATGWRTYSLQVNAFAGGSSVGTATATGGVAIVNRVTSPFGAGWWLQGLEQLVSVHDTLKLWVGGDGSTRLYRRTAADTNVFLVVHAVSRPDTLQRSGTTWIRRLPNGAQTRFDNAGLHTRTLSALSDTTEFIYASGTLDEIRLPRPNGTLLPRVKFVYTGSGSSRRLVTVRIRTGASSDSSGERVTTMYRSQTWRLDSIQDPDGRRVRFRADSATRRVLVRRNRLMDSTRFDYNAFGGIDSVTQFIPGDSNAVTRICAAETRSLVACGWVTSSVGGVPLPQSVTKIDGPRRGTFDVTTLVLNRWGGADTIIAPDGGTTRLVRDAVFPALVVKSTNPIGFEQLATYNARGLPVTTTAVNPVGLNQNAVTRYAWHPVWNLPDTVIPPLGAAQHFRNNANRPVVDSQWVVGHDSTKVRFTYDSRLRPTHVTTPLGGFERIHYDVLLGNVRAQRAGTDTMTVMRDRFGRDSVVIGTDASIRTDIFYDAMSRVDSTRTTAVGLGATTLPRSGITVSAASTVLRVSQVYDAEGNVLSVSRLDTTNQAANTGVGTSFSYDAARRVKSRSENGRTDSFAYNAAGQQTRHITARGHTIEQGYDAAGRLQYRLVPGVVTSRTTCQVCAWHPLYSAESFPYFPTSIDDSSSPDMVIPGTVRIWSYDRAGRDLTAGTYYADGSLKTRDGITMVRDLLGRVTEESAYFEKQWYSYHPALGHMSQTRAWKHFASDTATVNFSYDAAGRQVSRNVPGLAAPLGEARLFDSNGRTVRRRAHAAGSTPLFEDSLVYNNRGLVTLRRSGSSDPALADTAQMYYNGMGALIAVDRVRLYGGQGVNSDEYVVDGLGNRLSSHANRGRSTGNLKQTSAYNGDNQLSTSDSPQYGVTANGVPVVSQYDEVSISRDASGNETARVRTRFFWDSLLPPAYRTVAYGTEVTRHWYDAEQRLRATQTTENKNGEKGRTTFTRYRYDQFGRRVEIRVQRDTTTCVANDRDNLPECLGSVHTFKWFGDQIVSETRLSLGGSAPNNHFGTVHYVHAGGIDQPLFVISGGAYIVPHTSGRGGFEAGTYLNGTPVPSWKYHWPARTQGVFLGGDVRMQADPEIGWLGSLMDGKTDPSGLQYMRNRYYDPATGRFTQPDPIGLAGGLNLYGYAGGDPINLSDPFGLCPEWKTGVPCISPIASPMRPANSSEPSGVGGSEYGWTRSGGKQFHNGFDHAAEAGTAIVAPGDATVTAGRSTIGGNFLVMDLGNGTSVTVLHAEGFDAGLEVGKSVQVKAGTQVGRVGRTGNAANSPRETHGHVITRSGGKTCNPRDFFSKDGGGGSCQ